MPEAKRKEEIAPDCDHKNVVPYGGQLIFPNIREGASFEFDCAPDAWETGVVWLKESISGLWFHGKTPMTGIEALQRRNMWDRPFTNTEKRLLGTRFYAQIEFLTKDDGSIGDDGYAKADIRFHPIMREAITRNILCAHVGEPMPQRFIVAEMKNLRIERSNMLTRLSQ